MDYNLKLLPRNILTGAVVNGVEDDTRGSFDHGITLSWKDLSVTRKRKISNVFWGRSKYDKVHILRSVNGMIQSGNLTAIMGASGSGKTSLLASVSARLRGGGARGTLLLNGHRVDAPTLARLSGFLPQHDLALEELTVNEHMEFMARLSLDARTTSGLRARRIQQLLLELGVARCAGTRLSALSGGERKRVALAVQLLNDPPLLFCDEPTTGLDSWCAAAVLEKLRDLAERGKAVLCSVHQPASGLFDRFHQLLLLAAGRVAYHGAVMDAPEFFSRLNYICPIGYNESEYYVSLLSMVRGQEVESSIRIQHICDAYDKSKIGIELRNSLYYLETGKANLLENNIISIFDTGQDKTFEPFSRYLSLQKVGFLTQFTWLVWRAILSGKRNNSVWLAEFIMYMAISVMLVLPYLNVADDFDQRHIQNIQGLMYLVITETVFMFIYSVVNTFPEEIPIVLRDMANGLYSPGPYYVAKALLMIPRSVIEPTLYASLIFAATGLRGGAVGWLLFVFFVVLSANVSNAYGAALSASFESIATASLIAVPIDLVGTTFSGIFINLASLPLYIHWLQYVSIFRYGIEAISILQWTDITTINCVDIPGMPCIRTGKEVLERFGFDTDVTYDLIGLMTIYFVCHLLGYVMICRRSKQQAAY